MWLCEYFSDQDNPYKQDPFLEIRHLSYVDNLPVWSYPFHRHAGYYEMGFIVTGDGCLEVGAQKVPLTMGDIYVIPPGIMHRLTSENPEGMKYCTLSFKEPDHSCDLGDFFRDLGPATTHASSYAEHIHGTLRILFNLHEANGGIVNAAYQTIALGMIQLIKELFSTDAFRFRLDDHFSASDILNYIMETSGKNITLESLAEHFHVSQSHLSRIFYNAYHVSPINYAIYARITYSTEYLVKTDLPIAEIASLIGYDNPTHFTNMFIKRIGCTPTEYREQNRRFVQNSATEQEMPKVLQDRQGSASHSRTQFK